MNLMLQLFWEFIFVNIFHSSAQKQNFVPQGKPGFKKTSDN